MQREKQILRLVGEQPRDIPDIVANAYPGLDPRLVTAAGGSVLAHLLDLEKRGLVVQRRSDGRKPSEANPSQSPRSLAALVLGVLLGMASRHRRPHLRRRPIRKTIATSSLESMRAQNRLIAFVARYVSVVSSEQERLGGLVSTERTLILPGNVRYEVDLRQSAARGRALGRRDRKPCACAFRMIEIAGPEVDLTAAREYGDGRCPCRL